MAQRPATSRFGKSQVECQERLALVVRSKTIYMEEILKYLSQIALSGAAFSFVIGLIKWIDQRRRDQEEKQYQSFHKMVCLASGTDESGRTIKMAQQVAAIYQLQRYKQYAFASIPVLELLLDELKQTQGTGLEHLKKAMDETLAKLLEA